MADFAKILVEANGLSDVITIIKGAAEDVELPEKVDVIISEPMGIALVNERMLESFIHARKWLQPSGKMFPTTMTMYYSPFYDEQLYLEISGRTSFWNQQSFLAGDTFIFSLFVKRQNSAVGETATVLAPRNSLFN